jgi:hypothetical protein
MAVQYKPIYIILQEYNPKEIVYNGKLATVSLLKNLINVKYKEDQYTHSLISFDNSFNEIYHLLSTGLQKSTLEEVMDTPYESFHISVGLIPSEKWKQLKDDAENKYHHNTLKYDYANIIDHIIPIRNLGSEQTNKLVCSTFITGLFVQYGIMPIDDWKHVRPQDMVNLKNFQFATSIKRNHFVKANIPEIKKKIISAIDKIKNNLTPVISEGVYVSEEDMFQGIVTYGMMNKVLDAVEPTFESVIEEEFIDNEVSNETALTVLKPYEGDIFVIDKILRENKEKIPDYRSLWWKQKKDTYDWSREIIKKDTVELVLGEFLSLKEYNTKNNKQLSHHEYWVTIALPQYDIIAKLISKKLPDGWSSFITDSEDGPIYVYIDVLKSDLKINPLMEARNDIATYVFAEDVYPDMARILEKPSTLNKLNRIIEDFFRRNNDKLMLRGPTKNIIFTAQEIDDYLKTIGMSKDMLKELFQKQLSAIGHQARFLWIAHSAQLVGLMGALSYAIIEKNKPLEEAIITLMTFTIYPLIYRKYYSQSDPRTDVMDATLDKITRRFKITKFNNLLEYLRAETKMALDKVWYKRIITKTDRDYIDAIERLRTSYNSTFRKLRNEFDQVLKAGETSRVGGDAVDDEGNIIIGSNAGVSADVWVSAENIYSTFISEAPVEKLIRAVANNYGVEPSSVREIIKKLKKDKSLKYKELIAEIIQKFIEIGGRNINSPEFISKMMRSYTQIYQGKQSPSILNILKGIETQIAKDILDGVDDVALKRHIDAVWVYTLLLIQRGYNK